MPQIGEIAKVTLGNQELKNDIPSAARLVWEAFHELINNEPEKYHIRRPSWFEGREGVEISCPMVKVIFDLWPELSHKDEDTKQKLTAFQGNISGHLKRRHNVALIKRGHRRLDGSTEPTIWWVSSSWNDLTESSTKHTKQEKIVIRPPSEVTTEYKCTEPGCPFRTKHKPALVMHKKHKHSSEPEPKPKPKSKSSEPTPSATTDPVAAIQALVEENKRLRAVVDEMRKLLNG